MIATLPLGTELVLTCAVCAEPSSASLQGTSGWVLHRVDGRGQLKDICPCCAPRRHAVRVLNTGPRQPGSRT